jgi:hypothetical protein
MNGHFLSHRLPIKLQKHELNFDNWVSVFEEVKKKYKKGDILINPQNLPNVSILQVTV